MYQCALMFIFSISWYDRIGKGYKGKNLKHEINGTVRKKNKKIKFPNKNGLK